MYAKIMMAQEPQTVILGKLKLPKHAHLFDSKSLAEILFSNQKFPEMSVTWQLVQGTMDVG